MELQDAAIKILKNFQFLALELKFRYESNKEKHKNFDLKVTN